MAKDKFGNFSGDYVDQTKFNDIMTNSTPEDKVKLSEVHKSINRLASQLDKNQTDFAKDMKGISSSISATSKQQKKMLGEMKMRELASQRDVRAVEKSVNVVLGKLGYVVDAVGKNAKRILVDTAKATKQHLAEYGRALSADFAINKSNFVASSLAKASPIFGYFAGKFMETSVFKHFTELIKEKLGSAVDYVANKLRDLWGRGKDALKAWWRDPKKWKRIYDATATILKFPFKLLGKTLAHLWNGVKFMAKLPFKAIGLAFKLLAKSVKFIATLPFKAIGLAFKGLLGLIKLPFKMIGGAFGAVKEGYKSVGRKKQEKSREKYIKMQEEFEGKIPQLQKGGYIKKEGLAHIHAAEVVTPLGKLKEAFKVAISPLTGSVVIELRKLRYATVGVGRDVSASFTASMMRIPLFKGLVSTLLTMKGAYEVYKFWLGKRNKYTSLLSKSSNPQARAADNIGILYTGMMVKMDTLIANVQLLVEKFGGKPYTETDAWSKIAKWHRFDQVTKMYENVGGIRGLAKSGWETVKNLFSGGKESAKIGYEKGKENIINSYEKGKDVIAEKGGLKEIITTSIKSGGSVIIQQGRSVITIIDEKTGLGIQEKYNKASETVKEKYEESGIGPAAQSAKDDASKYVKEKKERIKESSLFKKIVGSKLFTAASAKLQEERGSFEVSGGTTFEKIKGYTGKLKDRFLSKKKKFDDLNEKMIRKAVNYFDKKIQEVKETKSYRKRQEKLETKIKNATEGTESKLSLWQIMMKKTFGKIGTWLFIGFGLIKNLLFGLAKLPFKGLLEALKWIGGLSVGSIISNAWKAVKFLLTPLKWILSPILKPIGGLIKGIPNFIKGIPNFIKGIPNFIKGIPNFIKGIPSKFFSTISKLKGLPTKFLKGISKFGGAIAKFGRIFAKTGPLMLILSTIETVLLGLKGMFKAREWFGKKKGEKVSMSERISSFFGAALGGTEVGWEGAKSGAARGAMLGAGLGMFGGPIGIAIGGVIGVIAGGLMGAIGGKNIAKGISIMWNEVKMFIKSIIAFMKYPFVLLGGLIERAKTWISEKIKPITEAISKWIGDTLDPLWRAIDPVVKVVENLFGAIFGALSKIKDFLLHPIDWLKNKMNKLGMSSTESIDVAYEKQKKTHAEKEAGIKGMHEEAYEFASGKSQKQRYEEEARSAKEKADKEILARKKSAEEKAVKAKEKAEKRKASIEKTRERIKALPNMINKTITGKEPEGEGKNPVPITPEGGRQTKNGITWTYGEKRANKLNSTFKERLESVGSEYQSQTGKPIVIGDTYRSREEQARAYANKPHLAAPPGKSMHEFGYAVDMSSKQATEADNMGLFAKNKLFRPMWPGRPGGKKEEWHVEPLEIKGQYASVRSGSFTLAATGGYIPRGGLAYLHPGEAVLPASIVRPMLPQGMKHNDVLNKQQDTQSSLINQLFNGLSGQLSDNQKAMAAAIIDSSNKIISYTSYVNSNSSGGRGGGYGHDNLNDQERFDLNNLISANL